MISYAITDPTTLNFSTLSEDIKRFARRADMIVYRDKSSVEYATHAHLFIEETKRHSFAKVLLHTHIDIAIRLQADGIHLTSKDLHRIEFAKSKGLFVVVSTHSLYEAQLAQSLGANMITYSPIFRTPNKGEPLGTESLMRLRDSITIPIIALGGILSEEQIENCLQNGASGFASIRYFG